MRDGLDFSKDWGEQGGLQMASSYIEDLRTDAWHDVAEYDWAHRLESEAETVQRELENALATPSFDSKGNRIWATASRSDAMAYGPDWRTLVLQDRGRWDDKNAELFPQTSKLVQKLQIPSSECFFAVQRAHTGIKSHTDFTNFLLTAHLGLKIPEGNLWIKCGNETRDWEEKKMLIMDTSFMHSTENNTDEDRYVLIFRFWHPDLTVLEKEALQFIFDSLDNPDQIKVAQKLLAKRVKAAKRKPASRGGFGGGGFGKR
ncbi:hypothetical protein CYMTET_22904 [Cymbomonas tetramitiformis]|uniref:Aspartyl/asparaginy/proline hydroxylase domain-containing protein n=1 Tax=Cymbomonas tetramitiformis TaxID=36881 RepID=A0AAE0FYW3_9CHLO|nr:hypothetical protein CYMTET_22904 [Cymbomonas tetramitiformis]